MKERIIKHYNNLTTMDEDNLSTLEHAIIKGFGFALGAGIGLFLVVILLSIGTALI